jgi:Tfp pilus assembly PilM family ATPase
VDLRELRAALVRQGFLGTRVVLAVPEEKLVTGLLELPPRSSGAPVDQIARTELANLHGFDPAQAEAVSWDLPQTARAKDATHAMAMACRHGDAEALLDLVEETGLDVVALSSRLHALVRASRAVGTDSGMTAILDLEWNRGTLILMYRQTVVYRWMMPEAAMLHLSKALSDHGGLDDEQIGYLLTDVGLTPSDAVDKSLCDLVGALIRKHLDALVPAMGSPLAYAVQLYPEASIGQMLLTGFGARLPGAAEYLHKSLGFPVRVTAPADIVRCPPSLGAKAVDPGLVVATGLALLGGADA